MTSVEQAAEELAHWPDEIRHRLEQCDGFIDLRMAQRAAAELVGIPAEYLSRLPAERLRLRLALAQGAWMEAADLARGLRERFPQELEYWIESAFATRRADGLQPALAVLQDAALRFPEEAIVHFNLACYHCQLEQRDQALRLLAKAVALDPQFHQIALEDEDLRPVWDDL